MPNLDEAFAQTENSSHPEITVDYSSKTMTVPIDCQTMAVRGDDNGRRLYFRLKKVPDELDLSASAIEIWYQNADGEIGRYLVTDAVSSGDEITFSFLIPATLAKAQGTVQIEICASKDGDHWHIAPASMQVGAFFDAHAITTDDPKYDIVSQLIDVVNELTSLLQGGADVGDVSGIITTLNSLKADMNTLKSWRTSVEAGSTKVVVKAD